MNHLDSDSVTLVRVTARAFAERYSEALDAVEQQNLPNLPAKILAECADLGWLGPLSDTPDNVGVTDDNSACDIANSTLLATLVFELSRVSPTLGTRLLCHHYARNWCELARHFDHELTRPPLDPSAHRSEQTPWLGVAAFDTLGARESIPDIPLFLERDRLSGKLTMVISGPETSLIVCLAKHVEQEQALLLIPNTALPSPRRVSTLGLHGLGLVDLTVSASSNIPFNTVAVGPVVSMSRDRAYRLVLPAYVALCRAILTNCQKSAIAHADYRQQGGGPISQLRPIREKLALLARSLELSLLLERALLSGEPMTSSLIVTLRQLLLQATDAGMQILGGAGYVVGSGQERLWRDARQISTLFGLNLGFIG